MILDLVLVPECAQDVGEQHQSADQGNIGQPGEQPCERCRHLPYVPGATIAAKMINQVCGVGHRSVNHSAGSAERNSPTITRRNTDQAAHDQQHRHGHEREAPENGQ